MKYQYKEIIIIILILAVIFGVGWSFYTNEKNKSNKDNQIEEEVVDTKPMTYNLCYYRSMKIDRGFYDVSWLKLNITGENVTGEFRNFPAEKDSKVGKFEGTVGPVDQQTMSRTADVWWDSLAEGMNVTEELLISFGDGSASVGFGGEQKDRGDGVYVYTDKSKIVYQLPMSQIDCESLDEKLFVEKYIRDNISTIATNAPVLGGSWYVIQVSVNALSHTAEVTYEDGHIESKANIIYNYQKSTNSVEITKFEVVK